MAVEFHDADGVAEHVADPLHRGGLRVDRERLAEHPQIVAVARAQHHAMFAEGHRPGVAVFGLVVDGQDRHGISVGLSRPKRSKNRGNFN